MNISREIDYSQPRLLQIGVRSVCDCVNDIFDVIVLVVSMDRPEYTTYHHQLKAEQKSKMEI